MRRLPYRQVEVWRFSQRPFWGKNTAQMLLSAARIDRALSVAILLPARRGLLAARLKRALIYLMAALTGFSSLAQSQISGGESLLALGLLACFLTAATAFSLLRGFRNFASLLRLACLLLLVSPTAALAQSSGVPAQMTDPHGDQPFGSYQVGDIDQIGFANGALDVRIPLFGHAGRGISHQKFWSHTNKTWFQDSLPPCDPTIAECPPPDPPFWIYADNTMTFSTNRRYITGCGNGHQQEEDADYTYMDETGTPHVFDVVTSPVTPVQSQCVHVKLTGYALDGSGMKIDVTDSVHPIVTLKDGTCVMGDQSGFPVFLRKDANGNMITAAGNPSTGAVTGETDTLGRTIQYATGTLPDGAQYEDWIATDSSGNQQKARIEWVALPVCTNFGYPDTTEFCGSMRLARKIDLPNGLAYNFTYDSGTTPGHYGELLRIDLPSGGYIRYEYGPTPGLDVSSRGVTKRAVSADGTAASEKAWTYSYGTAGTATTTVADPEGNQTTHTFIPTLNGFGTPLETQAQYYQGTVASGHLLKTIATDYSTIPVNVGDGDSTQVQKSMSRPIRITTTLDNGLVSRVETDYDPVPDNNGEISFNRSNVTETREFGFGQGAPGPLLRRTDYTYQHDAVTAYASANIVDRVLNTTVYDGAGNVVSQTQNAYDGGTLASTGSCQTGGVPNHDYCAFNTSNTVRGNLTSVSRWRNTDGVWLPTTNTFDDLGNLLSTTDPGGHTTSFSYLDSFADSLCLAASSNTQAFLTQVTNALTQRTQASYYSCSGLIQSKRDENDIRAGRSGATFTYDLMNRLLTATTAEGGSTTYGYHGDTLPLTVTQTETATPDPSIVNTTVYDGLGRVTKTSLDSDSAGADVVDTTYDNLGRKFTVSNPHRATASATDGIGTTYYDALGRMVQVVPQDGTPLPSGATPTDCQSKNICTSYSGTTVTVTDEAGHQRRSISDALGRLIEVDEPGDNFSGQEPFGTLTLADGLKSQTSSATQASGWITVGGNERGIQDPNIDDCVTLKNGFISCPTIYDEGSVNVSINGFNVQVFYGQGSRLTGIAQSIYNGFLAAGSPVTPSLSGSTVSFISKAVDAGANYSLSASSATSDGADFGNGTTSFPVSQSGSTLTGGVNANTIYDQGTVTVTVNSNPAFTASVPYGPSTNSTAAAVASALVGTGSTGLNRAGSPVHATNSGGSITITWNDLSATADGTTVSVTPSSTQTQATFSPPSFTSSGTTLENGAPPEGPSLDHNYYVTLYGYDTLGNLTQVTQQGDPSANNSSQWRVRSFTYNSLLQLLTAHNPESGMISYSYDADGNLLQKTSLAPNQTGAATQTISYCYDPLHRVTGKAYAAQSCPLSTPVVSYAYDAGTEGVGHMTSQTDQAGSGSYTYDLMGRIRTEQRTISGVSKTMSYGYDKAGQLTSVTYPSNRVVNYTPNAAGQMTKAVDANGTSYASAAVYNPPGALTSFTTGASISNSFIFNPRLQLCRITAFTSGSVAPNCTDAAVHGNLMDRGYNFSYAAGNNGNVFSVTNYRDQTRNQNFTYDALNRVTTGWTSGNTGAYSWGENYVLDPWGNMQMSRMAGKANGGNWQCAGDANNRATCLSYDAAGNVIANGATTYSFDAENRLASTAGTTYTYDADGNRVKKSSGSTGTLYWYSSLGVIAETDLTGAVKSEYVFFNGQRVARIDQPGSSVHYYLSDHLGSTSMVVSSTGTIEEESDYSPFGSQYLVSGSAVNHYKFTGKERDSESQMDYFGARYYSSPWGRFLTPDWSGHPAAVPYANLSNPQTLNLYAYVENNPITGRDLDGHINHEFDSLTKEDDGSSGNEGGPNTTSAARQLALMSNYVFAWQVEQARQAQSSAKLGIGIEPPAQSAVNNNVVNVAADPGHTFVYVRNASGTIISILSFGPGESIGAMNKGAFQNGDLPGNIHWPLTGNANTWEISISSSQMKTAVDAISTFKAHPPNYSPTSQCTSAALSVASKTKVSLPNGIGPVVAREYGRTWYSGNIANPYHLNQQMTSAHGAPTVVNTSHFAAP